MVFNKTYGGGYKAMNITTLLLDMKGAVSQGMLWSIMTLGVYISFRLLDYADLSVDGTFATGGAVTAVLVSKGMDPYLSLVFALLAGLACGAVTGILNTKLKIPSLLAGILTMIALYSVNLHIMDGKANIPFLGTDTIATKAAALLPGGDKVIAGMVIGLVFAAAVIAFMYWFFGTETGSVIRATGNNEYMARAFGVNTDTMVILGLMISNGFVSLSGAMVAQCQGYADVGMGIGTVVIGLASVIIGEVIMGDRFNFAYKLVAVVVGSIIYRMIIALVLFLGLKSYDLKLFTAIIVAAALAIPVAVNKFSSKKSIAEPDVSDTDGGRSPSDV